MTGLGHLHMVTDQDRKIISKELAGRAGAPARTWGNTQSKSAHPKSKFLKTETHSPVSEKANSKPAATGLVTVQEEGAVMKEWSAVRGGDSQDQFKSPSLFWEIRLKESKVRAAEHEKHSTSSSIYMIIEACDMLNQVTGRDAAHIDPAVLEQVREQIFTGLFADYATNRRKGGFRSKLDLLRACVPYYVIAERQFAENQKLTVRLKEIEKMLEDEPKAKSFTSTASQTSTNELNKTSGLDTLRERIDQMQQIITDLSAEKFQIKLDADNKISATSVDNQNLRDQLERIKSQADKVMAESEVIRANAQMLKDTNSKLELQKEELWSRSSGNPLLLQMQKMQVARVFF